MERHGFSMGIERVDNVFFLSLKAIGTLTHEDYEKITPMLENALAEVTQPKINAFLDATELKGWELRAAWDDFKLGLRHGREFERVAILGNRHWQQLAAKVGNWFVAGQCEYFEDRDEAMHWLLASSDE
ncbi:STAS/SEC14 domain-containing protein [Corallincola platygyrae]|uniref:STAS/SEC14 domain-containing protein n=1 Tax=Corallincola platygyrae TaxID=1193278 RepID=A0ABW4XQJ9_9GAMM